MQRKVEIGKRFYFIATIKSKIMYFNKFIYYKYQTTEFRVPFRKKFSIKMQQLTDN